MNSPIEPTGLGCGVSGLGLGVEVLEDLELPPPLQPSPTASSSSGAQNWTLNPTNPNPDDAKVLPCFVRDDPTGYLTHESRDHATFPRGKGRLPD